jgi:hypothetical protein
MLRFVFEGDQQAVETPFADFERTDERLKPSNLSTHRRRIVLVPADGASAEGFSYSFVRIEAVFQQ